MDKEIKTIVIDGQEYGFPTNGNPNGMKGERSYECAVCSFEYRESDIRFFRGTPYGIPCGCYRDIPSIIRSEQAVIIPEEDFGQRER